MYDSTKDTEDHINRVRELMGEAIANMADRAERHDRSKLESPEKEAFDEFTPKLRDCTYGSEQYRGFLAAMKPALNHHYANNSHHPEYYPDGVNDMTLFDLIEMLCDWKAATERHADGDLSKSIEINAERFRMSPCQKRAIVRTAKEMGFVSSDGPSA